MVWTAGRAGQPAWPGRSRATRAGAAPCRWSPTCPSRAIPRCSSSATWPPLTGRRWRALPQLAQVAIQGGRHTAANIRRRLAGKPTRPFRYHNHGIMATIGRRSAVAELPGGLRFRGTLGWLAWLGVHLVFLIGFPQPGGGAGQLGLELRHLGPGHPGHPRRRLDAPTGQRRAGPEGRTSGGRRPPSRPAEAGGRRRVWRPASGAGGRASEAGGQPASLRPASGGRRPIRRPPGRLNGARAPSARLSGPGSRRGAWPRTRSGGRPPPRASPPPGSR